MKSANRNSLCVEDNQQHHSRPALRLQEHQQWRRNRIAPESRRSKDQNCRNFYRVLTASPPTGAFPHRSACRSSESPPLAPPTMSSAKVLSSYSGADKSGLFFTKDLEARGQ